ncbi:TatD family hydrolase, partial [Patescibacteria group bacterium]|nr:TatD family hydrolase [Patescibacteria group bacterium]
NMKKFIDTHCHVSFRAYKDDLDEVIKRSLEEDVAMITVGTQSETSKNAIEIAEKYENVWATIGLHPNHLHKQEFLDENETIKTRSEKFDFELYKKLSEHPKVVAIGEFGLDYHHIPSDVDREQVIEDQKNSCREQLAFANEINKPIVIHCRDAHNDQFEILKDAVDSGGLKKRGVIHSFTGSVEDALRYKSIGFKISVNGILVFSKELQEVIKQVPLEQIMLETDAPYLAPPPYRGKRNEPYYVKFVAEKIAEIKGLSVDEVSETTTKTAINLFNLS